MRTMHRTVSSISSIMIAGFLFSTSTTAAGAMPDFVDRGAETNHGSNTVIQSIEDCTLTPYVTKNYRTGYVTAAAHVQCDGPAEGIGLTISLVQGATSDYALEQISRDKVTNNWFLSAPAYLDQQLGSQEWCSKAVITGAGWLNRKERTACIWA